MHCSEKYSSGGLLMKLNTLMTQSHESVKLSYSK